MLEITKTIEWDMGHRIPNHDGQCRYPHGHRYRLEVTLSGEPIKVKGSPKEGMLIDFSDFKKVLKDKIQKVLDHRFIVSEDDELLKKVFTKEVQKELKIIFVPFIPTSENLLIWCHEQIKAGFKDDLKLTRLRLYESPTAWSDLIP